MGSLVIISVSHAVEHDPSVVELADLPRGWAARRDGPDQSWERFEDVDDASDDDVGGTDAGRS